MSTLRQLRSAAAATCRGLVVLAITLLALLLVTGGAVAGPLDLDEAQQRRDAAADRQQQLQADLDALLSRIEELKVAREEQTATIERLGGRLKTERRTARRAASAVAERHRSAYMSGAGGDPLVGVLGGDSLDEIAERATLLSVLAATSRAEQEAAQGASRTTAALQGELEDASAALEEQTAELQAAQEEARDKVAEAQAAVEKIDGEIAAEKERRAEAARRRRERERAAAEEASASTASASTSGGSGSSSSSSSGGGGSSAPVSGGIACPVGQPRNYTDTYGAPRSGGRSHEGVDILAPMGTHIYAYENGTITRMDGNSLGGISLYMRGDSGNVYYYTHLSGYRSGVSVGQRVSAGQHIAYNGDSGNAAGIPHLHWEVQPGGGSSVNPYPYAYRACG